MIPNTLTWSNLFCFRNKKLEKTKTKENADIYADYLCESRNAM